MASTMSKSKLNSFSYLQMKKSCRLLAQQISVMLLLTGRLPSRVEQFLLRATWDDIILDWTSDRKSPVITEGYSPSAAQASRNQRYYLLVAFD